MSVLGRQNQYILNGNIAIDDCKKKKKNIKAIAFNIIRAVVGRQATTIVPKLRIHTTACPCKLKQYKMSATSH